MTRLMSYRADGGRLVVEVDDNDEGVERVSREDHGVVEATRSLEETLADGLPEVRAVLRHIEALAPHSYEVEFGVKLSAQAGVVVAKTAVEGHFMVKMSWERSTGSSHT